MKQNYLIENEGMIIPNVRHRVYKKIINNIDSLENISYKLDSNYAFGMSFSRSLEFCKDWKADSIVFRFDKDKIETSLDKKFYPISWNFGVSDTNHKKECEEFLIWSKDKKTELDRILIANNHEEETMFLSKLNFEIFKKIENKEINNIKKLIFFIETKKYDLIYQKQNNNFLFKGKDVKDWIREQKILKEKHLNLNFSLEYKKNDKYELLSDYVYDNFKPTNQKSCDQIIKKLDNICEWIKSLSLDKSFDDLKKDITSYIDNMSNKAYDNLCNIKNENKLKRETYIKNKQGLSIEKYADGFYMNMDLYNKLKNLSNEKECGILNYLVKINCPCVGLIDENLNIIDFKYQTSKSKTIEKNINKMMNKLVNNIDSKHKIYNM